MNHFFFKTTVQRIETLVGLASTRRSNAMLNFTVACVEDIEGILIFDNNMLNFLKGLAAEYRIDDSRDPWSRLEAGQTTIDQSKSQP